MTCSVHGCDEKYIDVLLEILGVDGKIILGRMLGKWSGKVWTGYIWLKIGTLGCHTKCGEFLDYPSDY
jgi:hypothetical protein